MPSFLFLIGGILVVCLAGFVAMAVVFAIPGNMPDAPAAKRLMRFLTGIILIAPIWGIICVIGYFRGWLFGDGYGQLLWLPLTLIPMICVLVFFSAADRVRRAAGDA